MDDSKTCPRPVRGQPQRDGHGRTPLDIRRLSSAVFEGTATVADRPSSEVPNSPPVLSIKVKHMASRPELDHRISAALSPPAAPRQPRCRITRHLSAGQAAGEPACRPGSVHPLARAGGHPSGTAVAGSLLRSTREHRAGRPLALAQETRPEGRIPLLTLLRVGFT